MSTYRGNPSLSPAVQDRVSSTYEQAMTLYNDRRYDEVVQGCTLILQMDPLFEPARQLLEKARNPVDAGGGEFFASFNADPLQDARDAMALRDFPRVIELTTAVLTDDLTNDEARTLGDEARQKMEAAPFIEQFAASCERNLAEGKTDAARSDLEKAQALDAEHPAIARMESAIASAPSQSGGFGFEAPALGFGEAPAAGFGFGEQAAPAAGFGFSNPSFVVDTPKEQSPRANTPAAEFGFTFEEERPAPPPAPPAPPTPPAATPAPAAGGFSNFSFDTPSADSPLGGFSFDTPSGTSGAGGGFDFSTASMETSAGDREKIDQYLADGDRAAATGDYQGAIDLWSRVFLIDVTNDLASERIEKAKAKRREIEQEAEAMLPAAIQAFDQRDHATARARFEEVLSLDPQNATARDYLDRMTETVTEGGAVATAMPYTPPPPAEDVYPSDVDSEISVEAPAARPTPAAKKPKAAAVASAKRIPMGAILAILGVLVLAAAGWFIWSRFLNKPTYDPAATQAILTRATALGQQGKYDQAIAALKEIQPTDPMHDRAVVMIADLQRAKAKAAEMIDGKPAEAFFQEHLAAATAAFNARDFDAAKREFEQAMRARAQLPPEAKTMYDAAAQQVAKLDSAKALFAERRYQDALTNLQALQQQDPGNRSIERMIVDAQFNLGALALQEERLPDAIRAFDEVLKAQPDDELARRSRELAIRYQSQQRDLLYRIYVKYLPFRQVS